MQALTETKPKKTEYNNFPIFEIALLYRNGKQAMEVLSTRAHFEICSLLQWGNLEEGVGGRGEANAHWSPFCYFEQTSGIWKPVKRVPHCRFGWQIEKRVVPFFGGKFWVQLHYRGCVWSELLLVFVCWLSFEWGFVMDAIGAIDSGLMYLNRVNSIEVNYKVSSFNEVATESWNYMVLSVMNDCIDD